MLEYAKTVGIALLALFALIVGVHAVSLSGELKDSLRASAEMSNNFDAFKRESSVKAQVAEARAKAQQKHDEDLNEKTHIAYRTVMDRIDAARLRKSASGDQRGPRSGPLPGPPSASGVPDGAPAECRLAPEIEARLYNAVKDAAQLELLQQWEEGVKRTQEMY
jgi:hypothetical protein